MRPMSRYVRLLLAICATSVFGSVVWLACSSGGEKSATNVPADTTTRLPTLGKDCPVGKPPTTLAELDACHTNFKFEDEQLLGDQQRLMLFDPKPGPGCPGASKISNCRLGPLARIQPEAHSNQWADRTVESEGRIIAMLTLDPKVKGNYPKLGLFQGHKTFWWVKPGASGKGTSFFISDSVKADGTLLNVPHDITVTRDSGSGSFKHAIARWIWVADDETTKGTCSSSSSCK
jgi:hypothetical protein